MMLHYDAAGFHAQQCIEKYLKALLQKNNTPFLKIHYLLTLMSSSVRFVPELELHKELLAFLNQFSISYRYPGESANRELAGKAVMAMKILATLIRMHLDVLV